MPDPNYPYANQIICISENVQKDHVVHDQSGTYKYQRLGPKIDTKKYRLLFFSVFFFNLN